MPGIRGLTGLTLVFFSGASLRCVSQGAFWGRLFVAARVAPRSLPLPGSVVRRLSVGRRTTITDKHSSKHGVSTVGAWTTKHGHPSTAPPFSRQSFLRILGCLGSQEQETSSLLPRFPPPAPSPSPRPSAGRGPAPETRCNAALLVAWRLTPNVPNAVC